MRLVLNYCLKQLLYDKCNKLIYIEGNIPNDKDIIDGKFQTITIDRDYQVLKSNLGVIFKRSERRNLNKLRSYRNTIVHHSVAYRPEQISEIVINCCMIAVRLIVEFKLQKKYESIRINLESIVENLGLIRKNFDPRQIEILSDLNKEELSGKSIIQCPSCEHETLIFEKSNLKCLYCDTKYTQQTLETKYWEKFHSNNMVYDFLLPISLKERSLSCPKCDKPKIFVTLRNHRISGICFKCIQISSYGEIET